MRWAHFAFPPDMVRAHMGVQPYIPKPHQQSAGIKFASAMRITAIPYRWFVGMEKHIYTSNKVQCATRLNASRKYSKPDTKLLPGLKFPPVNKPVSAPVNIGNLTYKSLCFIHTYKVGPKRLRGRETCNIQLRGKLVLKRRFSSPFHFHPGGKIAGATESKTITCRFTHKNSYFFAALEKKRLSAPSRRNRARPRTFSQNILPLC